MKSQYRSTWRGWRAHDARAHSQVLLASSHGRNLLVVLLRSLAEQALVRNLQQQQLSRSLAGQVLVRNLPVVLLVESIALPQVPASPTGREPTTEGL